MTFIKKTPPPQFDFSLCQYWGKVEIANVNPGENLSYFSHFSQNIKQVEEFDGVLLACGHHGIPYIPDPWPGQEKFQGKIIHAHSYKDLTGYEDKVVAVVGIGNSACDIAVDISRVAKQVNFRKST